MRHSNNAPRPLAMLEVVVRKKMKAVVDSRGAGARSIIPTLGTSETPVNKIYPFKAPRAERVHSGKAKPLGARLDLVNVGLSRVLVSGYKKSVNLRVLRQPRSHLAKFLTQARNCLMVHIGLRNELWHGD